MPTASGLAYSLGWLADSFAAAGTSVRVLQDGPPELRRHHFDHQLLGLFREGGNVPALAARSEGAPTRLVGLTWIDEGQAIIALPGSGITDAKSLEGARVALPRWAETRGGSFPRAMALHGATGALSLAGLSLADVRLVEVAASFSDQLGSADNLGSWPGIRELADGTVDAVYIKGARAAEEAAAIGAVTVVDLDSVADRRVRVNNGTPRPITVHERLLDEHFDLVVTFLADSLRAANWAAGNLSGVRTILQRETRSGPAGVDIAYRDGFHLSLHPTLSEERVELLTRQKDFLLVSGFLAQDFDVSAWAAPEPLEAARRLLAADAGAGAGGQSNNVR